MTLETEYSEGLAKRVKLKKRSQASAQEWPQKWLKGSLLKCSAIGRYGSQLAK